MKILNILRGRGSGGGTEPPRAPASPDPMRVPIGVSEDGRPVEWRPGNLLVSGYMGSGKSTAIRTLLRHFSRHAREFDTYLVDPRALEFPRLADRPGVAGTALDLDAAGRLLAGLREGTPEKRTALLVASAEELLFSPERAAREHLQALLEAGGVHVVLEIQRPWRLTLEVGGDTVALHMLPGPSGIGRAEFRAPGREPVELRTYYTSVEDLERREE